MPCFDELPRDFTSGHSSGSEYENHGFLRSWLALHDGR